MRTIIFAMSLALALAGCSGGAISPAVTTAVSDIAAAVPGVQTEAQSLCQWTPLADDVSVLIGVLYPAGAPIATMVDGAAKAICAQVGAAKASAKLRGSAPSSVMVHRVRVRHDTPAGRAIPSLPAAIMIDGVVVHRR
jgi:hypothetical protein